MSKQESGENIIKEQKGFSRRDFFRLGGVAAVGTVAATGLAACSANEGAASAGSAAPSGTIASSEAVLSLSEGMPKWSFMIAPEPVADDQITETITNDIIIVGGGMSGLTTATAAAELGAKVTLFSAASAPISRGGSNFAKNSKVIEAHDVKPYDVSKFFYNEYRAASFNVDQEKWMRGYNNSEEAMNWMIDIANESGLGVILERDNNYEEGPNYAHAFATEGDSTAVSTGQQGAVEALEIKALGYGVEIIYDTKAEYLIRDDNNTGRVSGVVASKMSDGSYVKFEANQAVVLATGDFSNNKEMLAAYCPQVLPFVGYEEVETDYNASFNPGVGIYQGDGQKMGLWVGAAWQQSYPNAPMWQGSWGGGHQPLGFHWGLNVNIKGKRYQREDYSAPYSSMHLLSQPGNTAFGIWTANYATELVERGYEWYAFGMDFTLPAFSPDEMIERWEGGVENGSIIKGETLDDLAAQLDIDAATLKETIARYNELCAAGVDEDFAKNPDFMIEVQEAGPFYAASNNPIFMTVMGGLRTSPNMEIMDEAGEPIPGLFNVGCMIGDMYANSYNFAIPGNSYGINCLTFGYLLGRDLAQGNL